MTSSPTEPAAAAERLAAIEAAIAGACARAGRPRGDVTLVAVSKEQPDDAVRAFLGLGVGDLGENRVQAFVARAAAFPQARWHLIGPVQTNKVKALVHHPPALLHTVDRPELVDALQARLVSPLEVLVQVNVDAEATKSGVAPEGLDALVDHVARADKLRLRGLMCIPRPGDDASLARAFARLGRLAATIADRALDPARVDLSMGMSDDFPIAIAEGATLVRIGTALFGPRPG
ncbi:MAG: YggS family pyridoxal phosphate-dependent enzyme [Deltaproteobacteria bacterium]|nr:YggS family pyridoxal phosphate-dependent enzyme [Deltaproteobacteria bacterium]